MAIFEEEKKLITTIVFQRVVLRSLYLKIIEI